MRNTNTPTTTHLNVDGVITIAYPYVITHTLYRSTDDALQRFGDFVGCCSTQPVAYYNRQRDAYPLLLLLPAGGYLNQPAYANPSALKQLSRQELAQAWNDIKDDYVESFAYSKDEWIAMLAGLTLSDTYNAVYHDYITRGVVPPNAVLVTGNSYDDGVYVIDLQDRNNRHTTMEEVENIFFNVPLYGMLEIRNLDTGAGDEIYLDHYIDIPYADWTTSTYRTVTQAVIKDYAHEPFIGALLAHLEECVESDESQIKTV